MAKFEEVLNINVNDKTEKKGNLTYLSWSWAWAEFKKVYPEATYKIKEQDGMYCTGNEKFGYMVSTSVTADGLTYEMWLPVMDMRNKAILQPTMFDINKTLMRCLTKNLAMFGLGLYIYAGEDLPEEEQKAPKEATNAAQKVKQTAKKEEWKLTKSELVSKYGDVVSNAEQCIAYYEKSLGDIPYGDWDEATCNVIRKDLEDRRKKKQAKEKREAEEVEPPFPMED